MIETVRYNYRLRPGAKAESALFAEWHRCRWIWNEAVSQQKSGNKPTLCRLSKMLTEARGKFVWLREGSCVAQQQTLRDYIRALNESFKIAGRGRPKIKRSKHSLPTLEYTKRGFKISDDGRLRLARGIILPIVWSRELPSEPSSVRIYQDNLGHWYASFVVRRESESAPESTNSIGIDWGVTTTATTTDPDYDLPYAGHRKRVADDLAKAQRKMSRRYEHGQSQSNGYRRAKRQAAKIRKKAARQRKHEARIWAKKIVDNHQLIAIEDFKPQFLTKTKMARKAFDAAIGAAKHELIERGKRAGREVVLVPPAYTTMTCSRCGERQAHLELGQRIFKCENCGYVADRDRNAAINILATAERDRASADDVRRLLAPFEELANAI